METTRVQSARKLPKGHGDMFKHWLLKFHPGALLVPIQRTVGSRQDLAMEGSATVYWNRIYYVEFLDECLQGCKENILQENLFIVLASVEMVALGCTMAIFHFKICIPLRGLTGNTHFIGQQGYDWSTRSMDKAIDALYNAMIAIEQDGKLFLDESFMNAIFDKIYTNANGNLAPLPPGQEAMQYQYEEKQTNAIDGSKVLSYDRINAEMFYPEWQENEDTTAHVEMMAETEVAPGILGECRDVKTALSDNVSDIGGVFSWGGTAEEEHTVCIGKNATNDPAKSPFASLTHQLQSFGHVLGIHASAVGHDQINGDLKHDPNDGSGNGAYFKLSPEEGESLLTYALKASPAVRIKEKVLLTNQGEAKIQKQQILHQKKMRACQIEYGNKLTYIKMANSLAFWKTKAIAKKEYKKLSSNTAKLNAVKEQLRICIIGFFWKDLHHHWSKDSHVYTSDELFQYLLNIIIPEQSNRGIPVSPTMDLPSRKATTQLGTQSADVAMLDQGCKDEKVHAIEKAVSMQDLMEDDDIIDRHEKLHPARPEVDKNLVGSELRSCMNLFNQMEVLRRCGVKVSLSPFELVLEFTLNGMLVPFMMVMNQLLKRHYGTQSTTSMLFEVGDIV